MKKWILFIVCVFAGWQFFSGCDEGKPPVQKENATWCVLLDMTGVRQVEENRKHYADNIEKIIKNIEPGDVLVIAMITRSSINEPELVCVERFPVFNPASDNPVLLKKEEARFKDKLNSTKDSLITRLRDFIINSDRVEPQTDIFSALHVASNIFKKYGNKKNYLVILSDMVHNTPEYSFYKINLDEKMAQSIIEKQQKSSLGLPDLNGVQVSVVGATALDAERFAQIRNFWIKYFKACGADLNVEDYGATLLKW